MLYFEFKRCFMRNEFYLVFFFMLLLSIGAFIGEAIQFYGRELSFVRSSNESSIIQGVYSSSLRSTLLFLLPLISAIVYADSFHEDYHTGAYKAIVTKVNKNKYLLSKAIVTFLSTFIIILLSLSINQILSMIAFPVEAFNNIYSLPPYDIGVQNYNPNALFDVLRLQTPLLYNFQYILIISFYSGLLGLINFGIYFVYLNKHKIFGAMVVFIGNILLAIGISILFSQSLSLSAQLTPGNQGTTLQLTFWAILLFVIFLYLYIFKGLRKEFDMED
ncbi:ABC transporter permease [Peribacillus sp. V2I11]|uniref:ABC transporter permease n=1 Tax=Peribacillus sp. V2I11 TaxID=3042277 RepID=UPI0027D848B5|nr:ABC transporter permease [Peribacillus sp. V2I11]